MEKCLDIVGINKTLNKIKATLSVMMHSSADPKIDLIKLLCINRQTIWDENRDSKVKQIEYDRLANF